MNTTENIANELVNLDCSHIAGLSRAMPFYVPENYFSQIDVLGCLRDLSKPDDVTDFGKKMPFSLPDEYFADLPAKVLSEISSEQMLYGLPATNPYAIPPNYFASLPEMVLAAARESDRPKRMAVPKPKKRILWSYAQWAAAAIFILGIGIGSYKWYQRVELQNDPEKLLASVSTAEIHDYLKIAGRLEPTLADNSMDIENMKLEDNDIVGYLDETGWD